MSIDLESDLWSQLPEHLVEHVCNQLPKVRVIQRNLKDEIESQRWMLAKSYNYFLRYCDFHARAAHRMFTLQLGVPMGVDVNSYWLEMTREERLSFYYGNGGPGSEWAREDLERQLMFREWRDVEQ